METMEKPLVTIVMPCIARPRFARITAKSVLELFNFEYRFISIIRPSIKETKRLIPLEIAKMIPDDSEINKLAEWCKNNGIEVIRGLYFPYVRYWINAVELCKTKYLFNLNCDFKLQGTIKPMLNFMESNTDVGVCATSIKSPNHWQHRQARYGVKISYDGNHYQRSACYPINNPPRETYHYCEHVHNGATLFRMDIFKDVKIDPNYRVGMGHEHEDFFLQLLLHKKWKVVSFNAISVLALWEKNPLWYSILRNYGKHKTLEYFMRKWKL